MSLLNVALISGSTSLLGTGITAGLQSRASSDAQRSLEDSGNFFAVDPQNIRNDELFGQLIQSIQAALGRSSNAEFSSSPFDQARSQIGALPGVSEKDKRRAIAGLSIVERGKEIADPILLGAFKSALGRTDFGNVDQLLAANEAFEQDQSQFDEIFGPDLIRDVLQGNAANLRGISGVLSDFPSASASDVEGLAGRLREETLSRSRADLLERADLQGINPAGFLGELERTAESDSLTRALTLLGGRQSLASGELQARFGALAGQQNPALAAATIQSNSNANAGSIAAQQALARSQTQQASVGAGLQGQLGLANTVNQGAGDLASLLLLGSILKKPGAGPVPSIPAPFLPSIPAPF